MNIFFNRQKVLIFVIAFTLVATSLVFPVNSWAKTTSSTYWLKVNTKCNVVNVYRKSGKKWVPHKVMLCSCGLGTNEDNTTPAGTYRMKYKWRWLSLVENQSGQYCSQITGDYLFHSVPYNEKYNYSSQPTKEFNKLGKKASHGCVRLSVMDAKWIYENCPKGTKITVYSSKNPGPLGKPTGIKVSTKKKTGWDPTDKRKGNPNYKLPKPVITPTTSASFSVEEGSKVKLKSLVTAIDPNTFRNLDKQIKILYTKYYNQSKGQYVKTKFTPYIQGKYKIRYKVYNKYCGTAYKNIYIKVVGKEPFIPVDPVGPITPILPDPSLPVEPTTPIGPEIPEVNPVM